MLFESTVTVSCRFSRKTSSTNAQWYINGERYDISSTFPEGIKLAFSNTSSAQLRIDSFTHDLDRTHIR